MKFIPRHLAVLLITVGAAAALLRPAASLADGPKAEPKPAKAAPSTLPTIPDALNKGVAFLVKSQCEDGSWGTGTETRGFEVFSMVPGSHDAFRVATTSLCVMALREVREKGSADKAVEKAHARGVAYLIGHGDARRDDGMLMYNIWAHIYGLQALSLEMQHEKGDKNPRLRQAAVSHLKRLGQYETYIGGWNYYDFRAQTEKPSMGPTSFSTAAGLVALWEAKQAGLDVPQKMIDLSLRRLAEMRLPNGAYLYGSDYKYIPRLGANQPRGSVGRTQAGNFALWLWGAGKLDEAKIREGLDFFFTEHEYIQMGRKRQFPHESWYQTAPYYYYFGHYYTALIVEKLGEKGRTEFGTRLAETGILPYQEPDGSWWDFAMWDYHKPYGTAFSIMTLLRCETGSEKAVRAKDR